VESGERERAGTHTPTKVSLTLVDRVFIVSDQVGRKGGSLAHYRAVAADGAK
jgi:hypothetical protein